MTYCSLHLCDTEKKRFRYTNKESGGGYDRGSSSSGGGGGHYNQRDGKNDRFTGHGGGGGGMNKGFGGHGGGNRGGHGGGYGGKKGGGGSSGGYRNYRPPDAPAEMVAAVFNSAQGLGASTQSTQPFAYQSYTSQTTGNAANPQLAAIPPPPPPIFLPPPPPMLAGGTEQFGGMIPPHMCYPTAVNTGGTEPQQTDT